MRRLSIPVLYALLLVAGCGVANNPNDIASPKPGQWVCFHCTGMTLNSDGSFTFPNSGGAVGYIYTGVSGNPEGKTVFLNYTVSGTGTVLPSPASGPGNAQVRLFLWRKGDDLACTATTEWYRWWAPSAGSLVDGQYVISALIDPWTDCLGHQNEAQFAATTANLLGIGFTFGAQFFGHGAYSTGTNTFKINSFTIQ